MYPRTCALMLALMKPSRVATRSSTRGTSFGVTVVTRTSGAGGAACGALREQPAVTATLTSSPTTSVTGFMLWEITALRSGAVIDKPCFARALVRFTAQPRGVRAGFSRNSTELKSYDKLYLG